MSIGNTRAIIICKSLAGLALATSALLSLGLVPPLQLTAPRSYVTDSLPSQVIPDDLDGDGDLDAIVLCANPLGSPILQLFNNPGDGSLTPQATVPAAARTRLAAGDLNGDGATDLVQVYDTGLTSGMLAVYLRNGPFSFTRTETSLPYVPGQVAIGNINNGGGLDLVISDAYVPQAHIYLGNNTGAFSYSGTYDTDLLIGDFDNDGLADDSQCAFSTVDMLCRDVNGDGLDDIVITHHFKRAHNNTSAAYCRDFGTRANNTVWVPNTGGGFGPRQVILDIWGGALAVGDVDNDGDLDVLTAGDALTGPDIHAMILLRNNGLGTFGPAERFASGGGLLTIMDIELADVDRDGDLDAGLLFTKPIAGNPNDPPTATWALLTNNGAGQFAAPTLLPTGADPLDLAFGNLDAVHGPEALTVAGDDSRLVVHYNEQGRYPSPRIIPVQDPDATIRGTEVSDIAAGDFNNDGWPDIAVIGSNSALLGEGPDTLFLLNGTATGPAATPICIDMPHKFPMRILATQIAGSPATDLAFPFIGDSFIDPTKAAGLRLGVTGGLPAPMNTYAFGGAPSDIAAIDINADGTRDLAVLRLPGNEGLTALVSFLTVAADGSLTYVGQLPLGSDDPLSGDVRLPYVITSGDIDGDGLEDLVAVTSGVFTSAGTVTVMLYKGGGQFYYGEWPTVAPTVTDVLTADLTGDGLPEVILTRMPSLTETGNGSVEIFPNIGNGYLGTAVSYNVGTGPTRVKAAQVDGQPGLDLLVTSDGSNELTVMFNDGAGHFPTQQRYMPAGGADALAVADFDLDGDPDAAVLNLQHIEMPNSVNYNGTVSIVTNRRMRLTGDANGDGIINAIDLLMLAHSWTRAVGHPDYDARADFNGDGIINVIDLLTLANSWQ